MIYFLLIIVGLLIYDQFMLVADMRDRENRYKMLPSAQIELVYLINMIVVLIVVGLLIYVMYENS